MSRNCYNFLGISLLCIEVFNIASFNHTGAHCYENTNRETNLIFMQVVYLNASEQKLAIRDNVKTQRS